MIIPQVTAFQISNGDADKEVNITRIPEMLGHFLNLNKMKTKRISNHMSQHFINNRT